MTAEASAAGDRLAPPGPYAELELVFRRHALIGECIGVLHWDMSVVMPPGGATSRAEQLAMLEQLAHATLGEPRVGALLDAAESERGGLDAWQAANLREMRRLWLHATALPAPLVAARSRANSNCEFVWRQARADSGFAALRPHLEEVVALTREAGQAKAEALGRPVYDALMDAYEPYADTGKIVALLDDYADFLPDLLDRVLDRQTQAPVPKRPSGRFPIEAQKALCRRMAEAVGLEFSSARLDESLHPFSAGTPDDSRITTRYNADDPGDALMAVLHESGHAMYERGRPRAWRYQPVGRARGMILHESQSLLLEMQICRSPEFFRWAAPLIAEAFAGAGPAASADNLYRLATRVEPGFIRVEADEVTYPAHIIVRTRLERAMMAGELAVADLPGAWNEGMKELLGITPPDDRRGCLQDIHWPGGDFGYFPTYTMGAMAAAQLAEAAHRQDATIMRSIARGDFGPLIGWLRRNVHAKASLLTTDELVEAATGRPLDAESFKSHLGRRYLAAG